MSKDIKKTNPRDRIKTMAVKWVADHFKVEKSYVYGILNGDHVTGKSDDIKKAYAVKYDEIKNVLVS